ncbi:MAG: glutathione-dependent formaldehyde dehydrogenase, partial [Sphingobacteriales bacterium]
MKAAVFHAPKVVTCDTVDDPKIQDSRDAIIRVTSTAICGSDLHIYNGGIPQVRPMVLGHEFMGIVEEIGPGVKNLKRGDRVVVPFPIACGHCFFCNHDYPGNCENSNPDHYGPDGGLLDQKGGALFGYTDLYGGYDGGQAEYARVPYADFGPRKIPDSLTDEQALFLTDIFPTGYTGVDWGEVKGGETVVIFGAGPVGLMAAKAAWLRGAKRVINVDVEQYR